jgi:hypothetical protein
MKTVRIRDLMNEWKHCPECGALMIEVPAGLICTHCGFETMRPADKSSHPRMSSAA